MHNVSKTIRLFRTLHCTSQTVSIQTSSPYIKWLTTTVISSTSSNSLHVTSIEQQSFMDWDEYTMDASLKLSRKLDVSCLVLPLTSNNHHGAVLLLPTELSMSFSTIGPLPTELPLSLPAYIYHYILQ